MNPMIANFFQESSLVSQTEDISQGFLLETQILMRSFTKEMGPTERWLLYEYSESMMKKINASESK